MLRAEGQKSTTTGKPITSSTIKWLRYRIRISHSSSAASQRIAERSPGSRENGVSLRVFHYWIERGIVPAVQRKRNAPYAVTIDTELDQRLREWAVNSAHLRYHPQRKLLEVQYARRVEMPSGLSFPLAFGMYTRLIGSGRESPA